MAKPDHASRSVRPQPPPASQAPGDSSRTADPALPSSLGIDPRPSPARTGRAEFEELKRAHRETGPEMTAGDVDADWVAAYSVGDEAPGGDNPTPGQTVVEEVGHALGVDYEDGEELTSSAKIEDRDRHRWELDPASAEDYPERAHGNRPRKKPTKK